ncbi:MAG: hypothetical protein SOU51_01165 [Collinsella sp.]|nr:hypothetical protein [Collinsella sp.]
MQLTQTRDLDAGLWTEWLAVMVEDPSRDSEGALSIARWRLENGFVDTSQLVSAARLEKCHLERPEIDGIHLRVRAGGSDPRRARTPVVVEMWPAALCKGVEAEPLEDMRIDMGDPVLMDAFVRATERLGSSLDGIPDAVHYIFSTHFGLDDGEGFDLPPLPSGDVRRELAEIARAAGRLCRRMETALNEALPERFSTVREMPRKRLPPRRRDKAPASSQSRPVPAMEMNSSRLRQAAASGVARARQRESAGRPAEPGGPARAS